MKKRGDKWEESDSDCGVGLSKTETQRQTSKAKIAGRGVLPLEEMTTLYSFELGL